MNDRNIDDLFLTVRSKNALRGLGINTVSQLKKFGIHNLPLKRGFGTESMREIIKEVMLNQESHTQEMFEARISYLESQLTYLEQRMNQNA